MHQMLFVAAYIWSIHSKITCHFGILKYIFYCISRHKYISRHNKSNVSKKIKTSGNLEQREYLGVAE